VVIAPPVTYSLDGKQYVAVAAGALMPNVASSISIVFSKISSVMAGAAAS